MALRRSSVQSTSPSARGSKSRSRSRSRSTEQTLLAPLHADKLSANHFGQGYSHEEYEECTSANKLNELWSVKYAPQTIADMCYPTSANKLKAWLMEFARNTTLPDSQYSTLSSNSTNRESKTVKGALLSGPPGVGKTTSVYVVARECGYAIVEYNASDFRSRKSLRERVSDVINNSTFASSAQSYVKVLLLMDEVDGCDIGGVGEVIEMIKHTTTIPIVCTCNDRWHPKLRSLMNHVEDIRFIRPPCNIVANYLCEKILSREGISLSKPLLQDIIKRAGSDIRNMLNSLQLWCVNSKSLEQRQLAKCAINSFKNGDVGLFEAAEYFLLQGTSHGETHTINEMSICYYNADLIDLFVQENYLHFNPCSVDGRDWMSSVESAASSMSCGDAAHKMMYNEQNWGAARSYVLLSSIAPCLYTRGRYESFATGQQVFFDRQRPVKFPGWLGFNSSANKNKRLLRLLTMQASNLASGISGTQEDVALDYIPLGWELPLTMPLAEHGKDGIGQVMTVMDQYHLMRDDWDFIQTIPHYKKMTSPASSVSSSSLPVSCIATATKTAFTREFNKTHCMENFVKSAIKHVETSHEDDMNDEAQGNQNNNNNNKKKKNNQKGIESHDNSDSSDDYNDEDEDEDDQMNDEIDKRRAAAIAEMKRQSSMKTKTATSSNTKGKQKAQTTRSAKNGKVDNIYSDAKRTTAGKRQTKATKTETKVKGKGTAKSSKTQNVGKSTRGKKRSRDESESDSIHDVDDTEESSCVSSDSDSE